MYALDSEKRRKYRRQELRRWSQTTDANLDDFAYRDFLELQTT